MKRIIVFILIHLSFFCYSQTITRIKANYGEYYSLECYKLNAITKNPEEREKESKIIISPLPDYHLNGYAMINRSKLVISSPLFEADSEIKSVQHINTPYGITTRYDFSVLMHGREVLWSLFESKTRDNQILVFELCPTTAYYNPPLPKKLKLDYYIKFYSIIKEK